MASSLQNSNLGRTVLFHTEAFEVVSIEWQLASRSPPHDHGWSQCFVLIEEGLFENTLDLGMKREIQRLEVGQVLSTPVGAKHEMSCLSAIGRTVHVYTPKLNELSGAGTFQIQSLKDLRNDLALSGPTGLDSLKKILSQIRLHSISTHSPYFMNQLFSGILPQMLLAEDLISQTKTTLATHEASPTFSAIESEVIQTVGRVIGWPEGQRDGVSVPGGSAANFMAIHCARHRFSPEIKHQGLSGQKFKIYVSGEAHYSFKKACLALGLGTDSLAAVPVDDRGRMKPQALAQMIREHLALGETPLMVAATSGTTVLGAFDPIDQISAVCKTHSLWLHVDAAWGGPALFSKKIRDHFRGVELADSLTFDAHKLFGASLTCSFFLNRYPGLLLEANDVSGGDYLFHPGEEVDRGKMSWQCGRKADAVSFWTIWKSLGTEGLGQFVDRLLDIQEQTRLWIQTQPRLKLVADPEFLNVCVRVQPPRSEISEASWSQIVRVSLKKKNLAMVNYSTNEQGPFLRLILAHPYLEFKHVCQILEWALEVEIDCSRLDSKI